MARVRSLSNHPYGGRMRIKGTEYEAADTDVEKLMALRRVVRIAEISRELTYATRELQPAPPSMPRHKRRTPAASILPDSES